MLIAVAAVLVGIGLLAYASDRLVVGAAGLADALRVPPIAIGVVVVGFGTSAPELLVSTLGVVQGRVDASVGNILGSNVANVTLLLGIGAMILPLAVSSRVIRREVPLAVGATFAYAVAVQAPARLWGILLVGAMAVATVMLLRSSLRGGDDALAGDTGDLVRLLASPLAASARRAALGLLGTLAGAYALLWGALDLAARAGLAEGFTGATLIAVGTSLPELVTVIQAARRGQGDLVVGNLLGSNLFNAALVGGVAMIVTAAPVESAALRLVVAPAAVATGLLVWWFAATGRRLDRREGLALIVAYLALLPLVLAV